MIISGSRWKCELFALKTIPSIIHIIVAEHRNVEQNNIGMAWIFIRSMGGTSCVYTYAFENVIRKIHCNENNDIET